MDLQSFAMYSFSRIILYGGGLKSPQIIIWNMKNSCLYRCTYIENTISFNIFVHDTRGEIMKYGKTCIVFIMKYYLNVLCI